MCNRVRQCDAVVFVDAAGLIGAAHAANISYAQRGTSSARANVLSCHQNGDVVVLWIIVFLWVQCTLPPEFREGWEISVLRQWMDLPKSVFLPAETFQRGYRRIGHIQVLVSVFFFQQNYFDDDNMYGVADGRVFVQRRDHIHDRQQVRLNVAALVELHHRRVGHNKRLDMSRSNHRSCDTSLVVLSLLSVSLLLPMIPYSTATLNDNL